MSGFFSAILRDGSLLSGVALLLAPLLLAAGIAMAIIGIRGRYRSTRPSCRACGFDLSGSISLPAPKPAVSPAPGDASVPAPSDAPVNEPANSSESEPQPSPASVPAASRIGPELSSIFPPKCPECGTVLARPVPFSPARCGGAR